MGTPAAEVDITVELVRSLLQSQHTDLAHLPIALADTGWDNAMFRLGDRLAVRVPRRKLGADLLEKEQTWLPRLVPQLTLPVPLPTRIGMPTAYYPWRWSVVPWMVGHTVDQLPLEAGLNVGEPERFADFLRSLHTPAPTDAPLNRFRGCPLSVRAERVEQSMAQLSRSTDAITPALKSLWQQACSAPDTSDCQWIHGDLHPRNVLADKGVLTGVIDWGDLTSGDVATDLAAIWMIFESAAQREQVMVAYSADEPTHWRAKGWAVFFGTILLETGLVDNMSHAAIGRNTLRRLAVGPA